MEEFGPNKKQKVEEDTDIWKNVRIGQLENGIKCYIAKNDLPIGNGTVTLAVKAGFLSEEKKETGIAHMSQHVLIRSVVEATGSFASCMSSHELHETTPSYTLFSFRVNNEKEFSEAVKFCNLIANQQVLIKDKHVEDERNIVSMEYIQKLQSIQACATDSFHSQLLEHSTLRECLGNLRELTCADVTKFYKKWYIPGHMALIVTGIFNTKVVTEQSCFVETPTIDCVPRVIKAPSWTMELITLNDSNCPNALVFKVERSLSLLQKLGMRIFVNATNKRLKESGASASIIDKGWNTFIVFADYKFLRLKKWGLTSLETEKEINLVKREIKREATMFCLDKHHQIDVLQKKFLN